MTLLAESLCQSCGFCCDGSLFTSVPLTPDDLARTGAGFLGAGATKLPQPCAALEGQCCTRYDARPLACRRYRCLLLEALEADETSLADAQGVVRKTRAAIDAVLKQVPDAESLDALRRAVAARGDALPEPATSALAALEASLKFHFVGHGRR